jgi:hypothetical protein
MRNVLALAISICLVLFVSSHSGAQSYDQLITKAFAYYLFDLKKAQWDNEARKVFPPIWRLKIIPQDTGAVIYAFDSSGERTIELIAFFWDANFPTSFIMVTFYHRIGTRPPIDGEGKRKIETAMQESLGPNYSVEPSYAQNEISEIVQFTIKSKKDTKRF